MALKKRGLGKGLDALLGDTKSTDQNRGEQLRLLPIEALQRGQYQPRKVIDPQQLQELADSISAQGVVQPIVARTVGDDRYEIIAGERRWRAAQMAGIREIPVVLREVSNHAAAAIGLIENIQRQDLNPLEEAEAFLRLRQEFDMTHQQVADAIGKSRTTVTNLMRLIELHSDVKQLLLDGAMEMGHARALLPLEPEQQAEVAERVVQRSMTVRATEKLVKTLLNGEQKTSSPRQPDPDIVRLQNDLTERLGAKVYIRHGAKGSGRLEISYTTLEELDGVLARIH